MNGLGSTIAIRPQLYLFAPGFAFGYATMAALKSTVTAELFGLRSLGAIVGVVMFSFTLGGAIGPVVAGHIFDITLSYSGAFWACTAAAAAALVLILSLRRTNI